MSVLMLPKQLYFIKIRRQVEKWWVFSVNRRVYTAQEVLRLVKILKSVKSFYTFYYCHTFGQGGYVLATQWNAQMSNISQDYHIFALIPRVFIQTLYKQKGK